ncbi:uncharacterized protein LOC118577539 isoform X2 [Onychomys torridus]|uniref:uncharacterized protein LOC118577539 isoform X2 n=1 Tax=Onychomys torridus TaxID=38674 RepID=UPI00167F39AF|nr:uncharacterized protein LOC118577539 isoform X2 [Onychomys torridus]
MPLPLSPGPGGCIFLGSQPLRALAPRLRQFLAFLSGTPIPLSTPHSPRALGLAPAPGPLFPPRPSLCTQMPFLLDGEEPGWMRWKLEIQGHHPEAILGEEGQMLAGQRRMKSSKVPQSTRMCGVETVVE